MQPLTESVWRDRFAELRPLLQQEFPEVARQELHTVGNDWDALLALLQRTYNLDADVVRRRLTAIDIDRAGPVDSDDGDGGGGQTPGASVEQIRLGAGFSEVERDRLLSMLEKLNRRLHNFPADATDLELSVKERDTTSQKVTLEAWLPKIGHCVATSKEPALHDAMMEVREDLLRQLNDEIARRKNY